MRNLLVISLALAFVAGARSARAELPLPPDGGCDQDFYPAYCFHRPQLMPSTATSTSVKLQWIPYETWADRTEVWLDGRLVATERPLAGAATITGLQPDRAYAFRICNVYSVLDLPYYCAPWTARTQRAAPPPPPPPPPAPGDLRAIASSKHENLVAWTGAPGLTKISISRAGLARDLAPDAMSFLDSDLEPATLYTYSVCFVNGGGATCSSASATTNPVPKVIVGDFTGDGKSDLALLGVGNPYLPVAMSRGNGRFDVVGFDHIASGPMRQFVDWAAQRDVRAVVGDFNGDGRDDFALAGGSGWRNIRVGLSLGDGTFTLVDRPVVSIWSWDDASFTAWLRTSGVQLVAGDFNQDGCDDLALAGGPGWASMPVALSWSCTGQFYLRNDGQASFPSWASQPGATLFAGNFCAQGDAFLLTGGHGWNTVPYGAPTADGTTTTALTFHTLINQPVDRFPSRATSARLVAGDLDGNGVDDVVALSLDDDSATILFSDGIGYRSAGGGMLGRVWDLFVEDWSLGIFGRWVKERGVKAVAGDFDGDGRVDLALVGGQTWNTIPVAFSRPNLGFCPIWLPCPTGWFYVTNEEAPTFARAAVQDDRVR